MKPASLRAQLIAALVITLILVGGFVLAQTPNSGRPSCHMSCVNPGDYRPVGNP